MDRFHQRPRRAGRRRHGRLPRVHRRGVALQAADGRRHAPGGHHRRRRRLRPPPSRQAPGRRSRQRPPPRGGPDAAARREARSRDGRNQHRVLRDKRERRGGGGAHARPRRPYGSARPTHDPRRHPSGRRRRGDRAGAGRGPRGLHGPPGLTLMPTTVIMPALELAQETGKVLRWIKSPGDTVQKGEPLLEIETDKVTVEVEAPASGVLRDVTARVGDVVPVGRTIALIFAAGEVGASAAATAPAVAAAASAPAAQGVGNVWRIMAERMTSSWTTAPHFYLVREANVRRLASWLQQARKQTGAHITYTDLLVRLVAAAIAQHPRVNVSWKDGTIVQHADVNVGLAVAIDDGLVVPVLHRADTLTLAELAPRREDLVSRAQAGKLRPAGIQGGTFTISNLGMFCIDAFNAIVNPPQAAILAVGRIADRVVAVNGQPAVQPTMVLTLSCDHRALDGARGARFLGGLADLIEEPLALLV